MEIEAGRLNDNDNTALHCKGSLSHRLIQALNSFSFYLPWPRVRLLLDHICFLSLTVSHVLDD